METNSSKITDVLAEPCNDEDMQVSKCIERDDEVPYLTVYKKKSTFKGATDEDFWYSGTLSNGNSVKCIFKCPIKTRSMAFEISNVVGNVKSKDVIIDGEQYTNKSYYISQCDFHEIKGEPLPL